MIQATETHKITFECRPITPAREPQQAVMLEIHHANRLIAELNLSEDEAFQLVQAIRKSPVGGYVADRLRITTARVHDSRDIADSSEVADEPNWR